MSPAANTKSSISRGRLLSSESFGRPLSSIPCGNPGPPLQHRAVPRPIAEKEAGGSDTAAPTTVAALARGGRPLVRFSSPAALKNTSPKMALPCSPTRVGSAPRASCRRRSTAPTWLARAASGSRSAIPRASPCSGSAARFGTSDLSEFPWPTTCLAMRTRVGGTHRPPDAPAARAPRA
jgi:hypothetical protein